LLDKRRGQLLLQRADAVDPESAARFDAWVARRAGREPAQHISGEQEFHGLAFSVGPEVLIPRPETEMLVDAAVAGTPRDGTLIDLGTGSGCIAIASAVARDDLAVRALDRSVAALGRARSNARRHGVEGRIEFRQGDFAQPPEAWEGFADTVVSNPPYVAEEDWRGLEPEVRDHDPKAALVPGDTGLEAYRVLIPAARRLLRPGGRLLLEIGAGQAEDVCALATEAGFEEVRTEADLNDIQRLLAARLAP